MIHLWRYFRPEIKQLILIVVLISWALFASFVAVTKKSKTLVLELGQFETRVIGAEVRPPVEIENFLHNFSGLFYTYNPVNYKTHLNRVVPLIDLSVMGTYRERINNKFKRVKKEKISQVAFIQKITRIAPKQYELKLEVESRSEREEVTRSYTLRVEVVKIPRSKANPFGLRISSLEEQNG